MTGVTGCNTVIHCDKKRKNIQKIIFRNNWSQYMILNSRSNLCIPIGNERMDSAEDAESDNTGQGKKRKTTQPSSIFQGGKQDTTSPSPGVSGMVHGDRCDWL